MSNRNGQGPQNDGPKTGRGRGFCNVNSNAGKGSLAPEQDNATGNQFVGVGCRGPRGCGNGMGPGAGRRGGGLGNRRRQI